MSRPVLSIVVPVYYNELNIPDTVPRLLRLREALPEHDLELLFVDDGSGDRSLAMLVEYQRQYPRNIKVIKLARNVGTMAAVQAGFRHVTGDYVGLISADLQDPPELFVDMLRHLEGGVKAAFAVRADREEPLLQKAFSNTFYALMRRMAIRHYPKGGFDFFLITRQAVDEVNRIGEKNTNMMTLVFWLGYPHVTIPYVRQRRAKGKSRWTMAKKIKLFVDSIVGFSYTPIRMLSIVGVLVATAAFLYAMFVLWNRLVHGNPVQGWSSLAILLALTSGIQMMMLGVLGEYVWRVLDETRRRPTYVIDEIFQDDAGHRHSAVTNDREDVSAQMHSGHTSAVAGDRPTITS